MSDRSGVSRSDRNRNARLLCDPGVYHRLVTEQHWSPDRYQDWLADALISLLIPASYQPKTHPPQDP